MYFSGLLTPFNSKFGKNLAKVLEITPKLRYLVKTNVIDDMMVFKLEAEL